MSRFMETFGLKTQDVQSYSDILQNQGEWSATDVRQAELVTTDAYYGPLYTAVLESTQSHAQAVNAVSAAGCFDDTLEDRPGTDGWFLSGSYDTLRKRYRPGKRNIALITTGSYDPMHNGHVNMIITTKDALLDIDPEANIVGGIMSSSHDAYVRKYKTPEGPNQHERVRNNQRFLENHPLNQPQWIIHDHWETQGVPAAVNFTDVINHVQEMLRRYVGEGIEVYYLFGSDAQGFAGTFLHAPDGAAQGVCVNRPGYDINESTVENPRCLVVEGGSAESSTAIRAAQKAPFVLRGDTQHATAHLSGCMDDYQQRVDGFRDDIRQIFEGVFPVVRIINVDEQLIATKEFLSVKYPHHHVVSADVYYQGDTNIRSSRVFSSASSQHHSTHITPLVETRELPEKTVFVDDDICTGFSLTQIQRYLPVRNAVSMLSLSIPEPILDVVDERDLLIGAESGGLMMEHQGYVRFPYLAPFVDLHSRASIPFTDMKRVNYLLWEANRKFYSNSGLMPADVNAEFLVQLGMGAETLEAICATFAERYSS